MKRTPIDIFAIACPTCGALPKFPCRSTLKAKGVGARERRQYNNNQFVAAHTARQNAAWRAGR